MVLTVRGDMQCYAESSGYRTLEYIKNVSGVSWSWLSCFLFYETSLSICCNSYSSTPEDNTFFFRYGVVQNKRNELVVAYMCVGLRIGFVFRCACSFHRALFFFRVFVFTKSKLFLSRQKQNVDFNPFTPHSKSPEHLSIHLVNIAKKATINKGTGGVSKA